MWIKAFLCQLLLCLVCAKVCHALKCDRTPEGISSIRSGSDGRFKLRILGEPDRFIPGENYTSNSCGIYLCLFHSKLPSLFRSVSLEGILRASHGLTHKFTGFFITAESDSPDAKTPSTPHEDDNRAGRFHIVMNAISKFSDKCQNLVTHTNSLAKSDVPVSFMLTISSSVG